MCDMYTVTDGMCALASMARLQPQNMRSRAYIQGELKRVLRVAEQTELPRPRWGSDLGRIEDFYRAKSLCEQLLQDFADDPQSQSASTS